jgi:hypothetical protein
MSLFVVLVAEPHHVKRSAVVRVMALRFSTALRHCADRPWNKFPVTNCVVYGGAGALPLGVLGLPPLDRRFMALRESRCQLICLAGGYAMWH